MNTTKIITSEYVSYGHPDKVADQISDALLDAYIGIDANTRAEIETMIKDNVIVLGGEVKTNANIDIEGVVRAVIKDIGYPDSHKLTPENIKIINLMGKSIEISNDADKCIQNEFWDGGQGFAVGMASNETNECLPLGIYIARKICNGVCMLKGFGPDVKTQVSIEYGNRTPKIKSIVVSSMHSEKYDIDTVRNKISDMIITNHINSHTDVMDTNIYIEFIKFGKYTLDINANGTWNVGGPISDCGLTGRKIVVDQYGGYCNVGGGAFSGKEMTKVDRSAAYMARYIAKNIVVAGLADVAKVELSYVISKPQSCLINVELQNGSETVLGDLSRQIIKYIKEKIDLTPSGIIKRFFPNGIKPIFYNTARYGHYGYNHMREWYPWEETDFSENLKEYIKDSEVNLL